MPAALAKLSEAVGQGSANTSRGDTVSGGGGGSGDSGVNRAVGTATAAKRVVLAAAIVIALVVGGALAALKLQDANAAAIGRELQLTVASGDLNSSSSLKNPDAYDLMLRGRHADRWDKGDVGLYFIKADLPMQSLASDPRFKAFLKKMNLPE